MILPIKRFQKKVLDWYSEHGRHNLPWQVDVSSYRVWVSEVMLQQTQVATVIPYFYRFMDAFPSIESLAKAPLDQVLHLWSGLGYYSRARYLHRAAQLLMKRYQGVFPNDLALLQELPGVGRSTAGAIASFGLRQFAPILDGNIKRLLARFHLIQKPLSAALTELWTLSEQYTPKQRFSEYNQAMMDLGAMVCVRKQPHCDRCPLRVDCQAYRESTVDLIPVQLPKKRLSLHPLRFLILIDQFGAVLLEKRSETGIWGNLWSFPIEEGKIENLSMDCLEHYGSDVQRITELPAFRHTLTHRRFDITPVVVSVIRLKKIKNKDFFWYDLQTPLTKGVSKPVSYLLGVCRNESFGVVS